MLAAVGALLALLLAEGAARVLYEPVLDLAELERRERIPFSPRRNADGFREQPLGRRARSDGTTRILMLGDSFTFGQGVPDGRQRFTELVEKHLNQVSGRPVHVYNAGVPGTVPTQWVGYARGLIPTYRPNLVVAVFFLRDGTDLATSFSHYEREIGELRQRYGDNVFYRGSYLVRTFLDTLMAREFTEWYLGQFEEAYLGDADQTQAWRTAQAKLLEIAEESRQAGARFALVIFPILHDLDDYRFGAVEKKIEEFAAAHALTFFTLTPAFLGRDARDLWVSPMDQHPNAEGHAIAAHRLGPFLATILDPS